MRQAAIDFGSLTIAPCFLIWSRDNQAASSKHAGKLVSCRLWFVQRMSEAFTIYLRG
jgi:hypothetical protein